MWFKINRRKKLGASGVGEGSLMKKRPSVSTPLKVACKSKKTLKRFRWPTLRSSVHLQRRGSSVKNAPLQRAHNALPAQQTSKDVPAAPVGRIPCGTRVIPIMRASVLHLPPLPTSTMWKPTTALKRRPSSDSDSSDIEHRLMKIRRLGERRLQQERLESFNPIYDDVYSEAVRASPDFEDDDDEAIYEEIFPPKRRAIMMSPQIQKPSPSYLDLMQVSVMPTEVEEVEALVKQPHGQPQSSNSSDRSLYALHGGDWVSIKSGIYDDVASSTGSVNESDFDDDDGVGDGFEADCYSWALSNVGSARNIPYFLPPLPPCSSPGALFRGSPYPLPAVSTQRLPRDVFVVPTRQHYH